MKNAATHTRRGRRSRRSFGLIGATLALLTLALPLASGCDDTTAATFRAAALDSIQSGLNSIIQGVLNGAFAVAQGDISGTNGSSSTTTSGTSATTDTGSTGA